MTIGGVSFAAMLHQVDGGAHRLGADRRYMLAIVSDVSTLCRARRVI
jgi:hypothetical protein